MSLVLAIPAFVWLIVSALFFALGEYLSKQWGIRPTSWLTVAVVAMYATGALAWLPALLHKNQLAVMGTAWLLLAMVATVSIGLIIFHEPVNSRQWLGITLAIVALVLLSI